MRAAKSAVLLCGMIACLLAVSPCSALAPETSSARDSTTAPQAEAATETAAAAAMEAMAKLKAAKADPPYYTNFPHGDGAPAVSLLVTCDPDKCAPTSTTNSSGLHDADLRIVRPQLGRRGC